MQDTVAKFKALIKAQSAITRIEIRAKENQAVYGSLALVFGLLGLGMLNVGAFLGLSAAVGPAWSAVILGLLDVALAAVLAKIAMSVTTGPEGETARELRDYILESLESDAGRLQATFKEFQEDVMRAKTTFTSIASGASGVLPGMSSVVGLLTSTLKKKKGKKS